MSDSARKVYVGVQAMFDTGGNITPQVIEWENGQKYEVDRVLDVRRAASMKAGNSGIRYLVRIGGAGSRISGVRTITAGLWRRNADLLHDIRKFRQKEKGALGESQT